MTDDLKHYSAVDVMDTAMRIAGAVSCIAGLGMLIVVALGWTS